MQQHIDMTFKRPIHILTRLFHYSCHLMGHEYVYSSNVIKGEPPVIPSGHDTMQVIELYILYII